MPAAPPVIYLCLLLLLLGTVLAFVQPPCSRRSVGRLSTTSFQRPQPQRESRTRVSASLSLSFPLPLVSADDRYSLWATAAGAAALGLKLERSTVVGRSLSGPVCAMLVTLVLTNLGVLPAAGSVHMSSLQGFVVKLATPLLLLGADLRKILRETGSLLLAFCLGTFSTLLGSILGYAMFGRSLSTLGVPGDGWKIASALTAKNIGGGLNFMAVCQANGVSPSTLGMGLSVDNLLGIFYFPFISWLGTPFEERKGRLLLKQLLGEPQQQPQQQQKQKQDDKKSAIPSVSASVNDEDDVAQISVYSTALAVGLGIVAVSEHVGKAIGMSSIAVSTLLTVVLASAAPNALQPMVPAGDLLGKLLLLLFFGSIGNSSGTVAATLSTKGVGGLLGFGSVLYAVHLVVIMSLGRVFKFAMPDILIASNANIGNQATASALASAKGWQSRLLPALLVGTFGNAIATFIGIGVGALYKRRGFSY